MCQGMWTIMEIPFFWVENCSFENFSLPALSLCPSSWPSHFFLGLLAFFFPTSQGMDHEIERGFTGIRQPRAWNYQIYRKRRKNAMISPRPNHGETAQQITVRSSLSLSLSLPLLDAARTGASELETAETGRARIIGPPEGHAFKA